MADIDITDWTKLGSVIRSARLSAGMTQHQLAEKSGTARSWIARIEAGHRKAEFEQILRLLDALDLRMRLHSPGDTGIDEPPKDVTLSSTPDDRWWQEDAAHGRRRAAQRDSWAASKGAANRSGQTSTSVEENDS